MNRSQNQKIETCEITNELFKKIAQIRDIACEYEEYFDYKRKLGVTGEIGEILACKYWDLKLVKDGGNEGFDAIDVEMNQVQIKSINKQTSKKEKADIRAGRVGEFSNYRFDYCLLLIFNYKYELKEVWKTEYNTIQPVLEKHTSRNPGVKEFIKHASQLQIPV